VTCTTPPHCDTARNSAKTKASSSGFVFGGSDEILLDDSVRMAERMRAAGCQVELEIWPRMPHTWQVWARVLPEARAAIERIGAFVQSKM